MPLIASTAATRKGELEVADFRRGTGILPVTTESNHGVCKTVISINAHEEFSPPKLGLISRKINFNEKRRRQARQKANTALP